MGTAIVSQGEIVANGLVDYLKRHPEMEERCSKETGLQFYTTDSTADFDKHAEVFFGKKINSKHLDLSAQLCLNVL